MIVIIALVKFHFNQMMLSKITELFVIRACDFPPPPPPPPKQNAQKARPDRVKTNFDRNKIDLKAQLSIVKIHELPVTTSSDFLDSSRMKLT